jgi:hypothetical protein
MPLLGMLAPLWFRMPQDPEIMLEWPADMVFQMLWYIDAARKMDTQE